MTTGLRRAAASAVAGVAAAALGHGLDATGRLPFVHEQVSVRQAMSLAQVALWLALAAAAAAAAAASRRTVCVGVPAAVTVSALPELLGRHDPGALAEPGALLGALVQWVILAAVVAVALVVDAQLDQVWLEFTSWHPAQGRTLVTGVHVAPPARPVTTRRSRAPPLPVRRPALPTVERNVMSPLWRRRAAAAVVAVPLVVSLAACGDDDEGKAKQASTAACPSNISTAVSAALPSDLPSPTGTAYDYSSQGKTRVWFFAVDGTADQLPSLRDGYDSQLTAKGYTIKGTDQEKDAEAESDFDGPHDGTTNFRPLCTGKVVFRLKLTS